MDQKEKLDIFRKLRSSADAKKDFDLLRSKNPTLDRLERYERNPERYADEILYALLDCCTADMIVGNRNEDGKSVPPLKRASSNHSTKDITNKEQKSASEDSKKKRSPRKRNTPR